MQIEIDIGNTRAKWRLHDAGAENFVYGACANDDFSELVKLCVSKGVRMALVSSVASKDLESRFVERLRTDIPDLNIFNAKTQPKIGLITFAYEVIGNLGVDRALAMLGAFERYPSGVAVIDAGSALTVDFVDSEGVHHGGYILPGYRMMVDALFQGTERVLFEVTEGKDIEPGKSTEACVNNGVRMMLSSTLEFVVETNKKLGIEQIVFAGGNGEFLRGLCSHESIYLGDLIFEGLNVAKKYSK